MSPVALEEVWARKEGSGGSGGAEGTARSKLGHHLMHLSGVWEWIFCNTNTPLWALNEGDTRMLLNNMDNNN